MSKSIFRCLLNGFQCQNMLLIYSKNFSFVWIKPVIFINFQFNLWTMESDSIKSPTFLFAVVQTHKKWNFSQIPPWRDLNWVFVSHFFFLYWALWKLNCLWRAFVTACNLRVFCVFVSARLEDSHFFDVESFSISMENNRKNSVQIKITNNNAKFILNLYVSAFDNVRWMERRKTRKCSHYYKADTTK